MRTQNKNQYQHKLKSFQDILKEHQKHNQSMNSSSQTIQAQTGTSVKIKKNKQVSPQGINPYAKTKKKTPNTQKIIHPPLSNGSAQQQVQYLQTAQIMSNQQKDQEYQKETSLDCPSDDNLLKCINTQYVGKFEDQQEQNKKIQIFKESEDELNKIEQINHEEPINFAWMNPNMNGSPTKMQANIFYNETFQSPSFKSQSQNQGIKDQNQKEENSSNSFKLEFQNDALNLKNNELLTDQQKNQIFQNGENKMVVLNSEASKLDVKKVKSFGSASDLNRSEYKDKVMNISNSNLKLQNKIENESQQQIIRKKSSRNFIKVRSNQNQLTNVQSKKMLKKEQSRALEDPYESFDYFYKIIIIGDESVGKTNLLMRLTKGKFVKKPKITYGVEFEFKTIPLPNSNQRVRAQIWDTSGAKQFLSITTIHYRFAVGAFLIYDITNEQSFKNLIQWLQKIREYSDENVVIALVGNKKDLIEEREVSKLDYNTDDLFSGYIESEIKKGNGSQIKDKMFKDVIQDDSDDQESSNKKSKKLQPNYRIESIQYEGGGQDLNYKTNSNAYRNQTLPRNSKLKNLNKNGNIQQKTLYFPTGSPRERFSQYSPTRNNYNNISNNQSASSQSNSYNYSKNQQKMRFNNGNIQPYLQDQKQTISQNKLINADLDLTILQEKLEEKQIQIYEQNEQIVTIQEKTSPHKIETEIINEEPIQEKKVQKSEKRKVTLEQAIEFARINNLIFLGETSLIDEDNNSMEIFNKLLEKIHKTQTELVRNGIKSLDDLVFGEEERNIKYDRCCY